jgi:hypothetical protein
LTAKISSAVGLVVVVFVAQNATQRIFKQVDSWYNKCTGTVAKD